MSNSIPQPVIWVVQNDDGTQIKEFDEDGNELVMTTEYLAKHKHKFAYIGLTDCLNSINYSINLKSGKFVLGGQEFGITKEHKGCKYDISGRGLDYRNGVIQYKCSKEIILDPKTQNTAIQSQCKTYNIGYKVDLPENFLTYPRKGGTVSVVKCQAEISINADSLQPSINVAFLAKVVREDGKEEMFRI